MTYKKQRNLQKIFNALAVIVVLAEMLAGCTPAM